MGRFGPVLVKPGRFGLILVWVDSALKLSRLSRGLFLRWAGLVQFQKGELENDGISYQDRISLWYKRQGRIW